MRSSLRGDEIRSAAEYLCVFYFVAIIQFSLLQHPFSSLYPRVPSLTHFFPHPPAPGLYGMQTEGASGVEVLFAFGPPLGLSPAQLWE